MKYLYENYGNLDKHDLEQAEKNLNAPFDLLEPFSLFVKRIEDIIDIAEAARAPYADPQIVSKAFYAIQKAYVFHNSIQE